MFLAIILIGISAVFSFLLVAFSIVSLQEKEPRAALLSAIFAILGGVLLLSALLLPPQIQNIILYLLIGMVILVTGLFLLPVGMIQPGPKTPTGQVDERTIIFARARLEPGSPEFNAYYHDHPHHLKADDESRKKPGLLSPDAKRTDPYSIAAAKGSIHITEALRETVEGSPAAHKRQPSPADLTSYVKSLAKHYGALDCGITKLKPAHLYSHIGRGSGTYGAPIELNHTFAVALTVEMDFFHTATAPDPTQIMESCKEYVESARIAVQLAAALRELGHDSRAHIDGNYRVIAPLVARDAGLGEIGRMGLLMTPKQGPRVRISVVTTKASLQPDPYHSNPAVLDFCRICQKCANNCPSQSISYGERTEDRGILRWKLEPESCYHYWTVIGTDCGRCLAVCPFSHPDHWSHNLIRWGINRSGAFRRAALLLDDLFYGKNPPAKKTLFPFPQ